MASHNSLYNSEKIAPKLSSKWTREKERLGFNNLKGVWFVSRTYFTFVCNKLDEAVGFFRHFAHTHNHKNTHKNPHSFAFSSQNMYITALELRLLDWISSLHGTRGTRINVTDVTWTVPTCPVFDCPRAHGKFWIHARDTVTQNVTGNWIRSPWHSLGRGMKYLRLCIFP